MATVPWNNVPSVAKGLSKAVLANTHLSSLRVIYSYRALTFSTALVSRGMSLSKYIANSNYHFYLADITNNTVLYLYSFWKY